MGCGCCSHRIGTVCTAALPESSALRPFLLWWRRCTRIKWRVLMHAVTLCRCLLPGMCCRFSRAGGWSPLSWASHWSGGTNSSTPSFAGTVMVLPWYGHGTAAPPAPPPVPPPPTLAFFAWAPLRDAHSAWQPGGARCQLERIPSGLGRNVTTFLLLIPPVGAQAKGPGVRRDAAAAHCKGRSGRAT